MHREQQHSPDMVTEFITEVWTYRHLFVIIQHLEHRDERTVHDEYYE